MTHTVTIENADLRYRNKGVQNMGVMIIPSGKLNRHLRAMQRTYLFPRERLHTALQHAVTEEIGEPYPLLDFWYDRLTDSWIVDLDEPIDAATGGEYIVDLDEPIDAATGGEY